jgi:hypothetical protein
MNGRHYETALCRDGVARREQHAAAEHVHLSLSQMFTVYGKELERVEVFKYLGHLLAYDNNNAQAVRGNLNEVLAVWSRLSCTEVRKCISPCMRHILQSNRAIDPTV